MKPALLSLMFFLALSVRVAAGEPAQSSPCLPAGSENLLLEVRGTDSDRLLPLRLRSLGFTRSGGIALLEQREADDSDGAFWILRIVDLGDDRVRVEQEFETTDDAMTTFCKDHAGEVKGILRTNAVEPSPGVALEPFPLKVPGGEVSIELKEKGPDENGVTSFEVCLQSRQGVKRVGVLLMDENPASVSPIGRPTVLGALRSPREPLIAVLIRQDETGVEAAVTPLVRIMGPGWIPAGRPPVELTGGSRRGQRRCDPPGTGGRKGRPRPSDRTRREKFFKKQSRVIESNKLK